MAEQLGIQCTKCGSDYWNVRQPRDRPGLKRNCQVCKNDSQQARRRAHGVREQGTGPCRKCGSDDWYHVSRPNKFVKKRDKTDRMCRLCAKRRRKKDYHKHKERRKPDKLRRSRRDRLAATLKEHGLSQKDYANMIESQGGVCAICESVDGHRRLSVDHCHKTGRVRGLLCRTCNVGIGALGDSPNLLAKARRYLQGE